MKLLYLLCLLVSCSTLTSSLGNLSVPEKPLDFMIVDDEEGEQELSSQLQEIDERSNGWSPWSEWTPCSRSCDGGASHQIRSCQNGPCKGKHVRYKICNMQAIITFFACLAACSNASWLYGSSTKVIQGPSSRTTVVGPDGSAISAVAPGGQIIHEEHPGVVAHAAPVLAHSAHVVAHATPVVAHSAVVAHHGSPLTYASHHNVHDYAIAPLTHHGSPLAYAGHHGVHDYAVAPVAHHGSPLTYAGHHGVHGYALAPVAHHGSPLAYAGHHGVHGYAASPVAHHDTHLTYAAQHGLNAYATAPVHSTVVAHGVHGSEDVVVSGPSGTVATSKSHAVPYTSVVGHHGLYH